jgi:hypothetical protein
MKNEIWDKINSDEELVFIQPMKRGFSRPALKVPMKKEELKINDSVICLYEIGEVFTVINLFEESVVVKTSEETSRTVFLDSCLTKNKALELFKIAKKKYKRELV